MASKMEKIKEQQRKKAEELAKREREHETKTSSAAADTTDFTDDLVNAIAKGEMDDVGAAESTPIPEPAKVEDEEAPKKETQKKETAKESTTPAKPTEKKVSESKPTQKESEPQSLSSKLVFQVKPEAKSIHKSIALRPATAKKADKLLKEQYNGLSFNDLVQQLIDVWVEENEKHFKV